MSDGFKTDPTQSQSGFTWNSPTIICLLYLGGFLTGVSPLIGIVLAYIWRGEPHPEWQNSHYEFLIRTFWFAVAQGVVAAILSILVIGLFIFIWIAIWIVVRVIKALLAAQREQPIPDAQALLW